MKKQPVFVTALLIVALLSLVIPASAFAQNEPIGERIAIWYGSPEYPYEFPEETPFYISHGWIQTSDDGAIGLFDFTLELDGVLYSEGFKMFSEVSGDPELLTRLWVYNFPDGMTGTHTFTGHWYAPCQYAVDSLNFPGPCATPNDKVETNSRTLVVNFVPNP